jgi:hypothetical protein
VFFVVMQHRRSFHFKVQHRWLQQHPDLCQHRGLQEVPSHTTLARRYFRISTPSCRSVLPVWGSMPRTSTLSSPVRTPP